jgi:hypothetical protein
MSIGAQATLYSGQVQHFRDNGWYLWRKQVSPPERLTGLTAIFEKEASLHDGRIVRRAPANIGQHRRAGYTVRYFSADIRVIPEANPGHRLWLARGRDRAGNTYVSA